ncbi:MAG: ABC transporter permease [Gemmatimonadales bacterium]|nr:Tungstate uptake system permease protein TupB [bacterium HR33]GIW52561.1 MAG: ABC transporter permease [Gemmatimonadales bacterium]
MDFFGDGLRRGLELILGGDPEVLGITFLSVRVALVATVVACVIGVPVGFVVGTTRFFGRRALITVLNTMLAFPTVVVGLIVWGLLSRRGPLGDLGLLYTWWAIVIAEVILAVPIAAALTAAAVQGIDPRVRRTALTLGASGWRVHWLVAREARFALLAAVVVAFGRVLAEVGAAMIVGGNIRHQTRTLTTAVALATSQGDFPLAVALGLILLGLALTVNVLLQLLQGRGDA